MLNFAIPDGHQMRHVLNFFGRAGICFEGYEPESLNRRPVLKITSGEAGRILNNPEAVMTKVIRPQDMPMHVAANNFDIAITGTDWLKEHMIRFPGSPVENLLEMGFGRVRIVAAVHESLPVSSVNELTDYLNSFGPDRNFRIASEYTYIADDYAREHNLYRYSIIMTYGATESLIPEDAEMIIENTETGATLQKNSLRIIDTLFESQGCLIANRASIASRDKGKIIRSVKTLFEAHVQ